MLEQIKCHGFYYENKQQMRNKMYDAMKRLCESRVFEYNLGLNCMSKESATWYLHRYSTWDIFSLVFDDFIDEDRRMKTIDLKVKKDALFRKQILDESEMNNGLISLEDIKDEIDNMKDKIMRNENGNNDDIVNRMNEKDIDVNNKRYIMDRLFNIDRLAMICEFKLTTMNKTRSIDINGTTYIALREHANIINIYNEIVQPNNSLMNNEIIDITYNTAEASSFNTEVPITLSKDSLITIAQVQDVDLLQNSSSGTIVYNNTYTVFTSDNIDSMLNFAASKLSSMQSILWDNLYYLLCLLTGILCLDNIKLNLLPVVILPCVPGIVFLYCYSCKSGLSLISVQRWIMDNHENHSCGILVNCDLMHKHEYRTKLFDDNG